MNKIINVIIALFSFLIAFGIAYSTGLSSVVMAVCLAYLIQWLLFVPAYVFQTEKFYDLAGGLTYITVVIFSLAVTSDADINLANLIIAIFIIIWAIRLSSFLFLRISKDGEDKRFRSIKPNLTQFFMTWTLQGMWVSLCSMCALTAINTGRLEVMNIFFIIGACIFVTGLYIEIKGHDFHRKHHLDPGFKLLEVLNKTEYSPSIIFLLQRNERRQLFPFIEFRLFQ